MTVTAADASAGESEVEAAGLPEQTGDAKSWNVSISYHVWPGFPEVTVMTIQQGPKLRTVPNS